MKQLSKKKRTILVIFGLLLLTTIGLTIAYYNSQKVFENVFHVGAPGIVMYEDFNPADKWVPEEEKGKQAWFTNTGEMDMLLRFKIDAIWEIPPTINGLPIPGREYHDPVGSDVLKFYWKDSQDDPSKGHQPGVDNEVEGVLGPIELGDAGKYSEFDFIQIGDYYYYKKVLKAKGSDMSSTQHVLESVEFDPHLSNDGHHNSDYTHTQIDLTITGETVLVDKRAVEEQWPEVVVKFMYDEEKNITSVSWVPSERP